MQECAEVMEREVAREAQSNRQHKSKFSIQLLEGVEAAANEA